MLADLSAVAVFVLVGRASHHESLTAGGLLTTGWPFIVGVAGGYVGAAMTGWPVAGLRGGGVIALKCVILGLVIRYGVQRDGTPLPFVVVTAVVLTALMLGWRLLAATLARLARLTRLAPATDSGSTPQAKALP